jgi:hypothetical protein
MVQLLLDRGADPNTKGKVSIHRRSDGNIRITEKYIDLIFHAYRRLYYDLNSVCGGNFWSSILCLSVSNRMETL